MSDQEKQKPGSDQDSNASPAERTERSGRERKGRRKHNAANRPLDESVNMDELREIVELIAEHGFTDFELENKDVRVRLRRELAPQIVNMPSTPPQTTETHAPSGAGATRNVPVSSATDDGVDTKPSGDSDAGSASAETEGLRLIPSPIVGTFFRSPSPNAEPFVRIGSQVNADTTVCIIEAMKLMNEIQAELSGVIEKIFVENGQPVEYGQPLFAVKQ